MKYQLAGIFHRRTSVKIAFGYVFFLALLVVVSQVRQIKYTTKIKCGFIKSLNQQQNQIQANKQKFQFLPNMVHAKFDTLTVSPLTSNG